MLRFLFGCLYLFTILLSYQISLRYQHEINSLGGSLVLLLRRQT